MATYERRDRSGTLVETFEADTIGEIAQHRRIGDRVTLVPPTSWRSTSVESGGRHDDGALLELREKAVELSDQEKRDQIGDALADYVTSKSNSGAAADQALGPAQAYVVDVYPDHVIFQGKVAGESGTFSVDYAIDDNGKVTFGSKVMPVAQKRSWEPAAAAAAGTESRRSSAAVGSLVESFRELGFSDRAAETMARGRDGSPSDDAYRVAVARSSLRQGAGHEEHSAESSLAERFRELGLSERGAASAARGLVTRYGPRTYHISAPAARRERVGGGQRSAAPVSALAESFKQLGLSDKMAERAAQVRR